MGVIALLYEQGLRFFGDSALPASGERDLRRLACEVVAALPVQVPIRYENEMCRFSI
jgi:hypothetical protein